METQTKTCQSCKQSFTIEPEDFDFYKKIQVPPPTWCPPCRAARRLSWRNVWHLYKKTDEKSGQPIFAAFPPDSRIKIYDKDYWFSDAWDPCSYGRDIEWNRSFWDQFFELLYTIPVPAHAVANISNCEYCTNISGCKGCYLVRAASYTEDSAYLVWDAYSKQCMDSHMTDHCEVSYGNVNCERCYKALFSVNCFDCQDVILSKDCVGCNSCVGCVGLRGKSYHIFNQPYSKEEYAQKLDELNVGSRKSFDVLKKQAREFWLKFPVKFMQGIQNVDVTGDYIYESKNSKNCFRVRGVENSKYCMNFTVSGSRDCYDYANFGNNSELLYEALVCGDNTYGVKFCWNCHTGAKNIQYSILCQGAQDCFGCVSARKKQYCILNKQYTKEEYEALLPQVIDLMNKFPYTDKAGRVYTYGEFFPPEMSPFPYNITEAQELYPKTKEQVLAEGLLWREEEKRNYTVTKSAKELPDDIQNASSDIAKETIGCAHEGNCEHECITAFKIIPREYEFLKQLNLPLPNLCPNCRHYERLNDRNRPEYFERICMCEGRQGGSYKNTATHQHGANPCAQSFKTAFAPDRPEIVYCEQCYQQEIV